MLCYVALLYNMKTAGLYRLHVGLDYCGCCERFELYNQTTGKEYTAKFRQARPPRRWKQHSNAAFCTVSFCLGLPVGGRRASASAHSQMTRSHLSTPCLAVCRVTAGTWRST
jgi:hypothetical protein